MKRATATGNCHRFTETRREKGKNRTRRGGRDDRKMRTRKTQNWDRENEMNWKGEKRAKGESSGDKKTKAKKGSRQGNRGRGGVLLSHLPMQRKRGGKDEDHPPSLPLLLHPSQLFTYLQVKFSPQKSINPTPT